MNQTLRDIYRGSNALCSTLQDGQDVRAQSRVVQQHADDVIAQVCVRGYMITRCMAWTDDWVTCLILQQRVN